MKTEKQNRRKNTINHINRIIGQLEKLREYAKSDKECKEIAALATSIAKSCDSLRMRTLEGFLLHDIPQGELTEEQKEELHKVIEHYKK
ncbi:MAG: metal-sensing transcriptional repressor [Candidatus Magasanikbacteria bacterium]